MQEWKGHERLWIHQKGLTSGKKELHYRKTPYWDWVWSILVTALGSILSTIYMNEQVNGFYTITILVHKVDLN